MSIRSSLLSTALVAAAATAVAGTAGAGTAKSPFCFAGSPTPKYICDAIKANTKPAPAPQRVRHDTAKNAIANIR